MKYESMKPGDPVVVKIGHGRPQTISGVLKGYQYDLVEGDEVTIDIILPVKASWASDRVPDESIALSTERKTKVSKSTRKVSHMEKFTASVVRNSRTRVMTIYVEDKDGKFLTSTGTRQERALGTEPPVYMSMPQEIYNAIVRNHTHDDYEDEEKS